MKAFTGLLFLIVATQALSNNPCPPEQVFDWTIEKLVAHEDCSKFYQCVHGLPVVRICPAGLHFNEPESICDWPANVKCQNSSDPITNATTVEDISTNAKEIAELIQSLAEKPTVVEGNSTTEAPETTSEPSIEFLENGCPVDPQIHWLLPETYNCTIFYSCVWGLKVQLECPSNLHFNKNLQVCDWPLTAGCLGNAEETPA